MAKAIFTMRAGSIYDDIPEIRYHFPRTYLRAVEAARDDWIIYYEPRRGSGRECYFAVAKIAEVVPDERRKDHFYAYIQAGSYLDFIKPVPWRLGTRTFEPGLAKEDGTTNKGLFGRSVRAIDETVFMEILAAGFQAIDNNVPDFVSNPLMYPGVQEDQALFETQARTIVETLVNRRERDRAFAATVKSAYHQTCAVTGLCLINGGGHSEVEAAHIRPVKDDGPDSLRNGIALCGTVHWMFDRSLISVSDEHKLLVSKPDLPEALRTLFPADGRLRLPEKPALRPHPKFLSFHRERYFKGQRP